MYDQLKNNFDNIEPNFELGEILMALSVIDNKNDYLKQQINDLMNKEMTDKSTDHQIFRYNWYAKLIHYAKNEKYARYLIREITKYIDGQPNNTETNYYAVEFEALATIYANIKSDRYKKSLEPYIEQLIIKLETRRMDDWGLYQFTNGTARVDITGHVLNGIYVLGLPKSL